MGCPGPRRLPPELPGRPISPTTGSLSASPKGGKRSGYRFRARVGSYMHVGILGGCNGAIGSVMSVAVPGVSEGLGGGWGAGGVWSEGGVCAEPEDEGRTLPPQYSHAPSAGAGRDCRYSEYRGRTFSLIELTTDERNARIFLRISGCEFPKRICTFSFVNGLSAIPDKCATESVLITDNLKIE